ncbi:MAG: hypothetical protein ABIV94_00175 [Acidimicrobiales bacterium]
MTAKVEGDNAVAVGQEVDLVPPVGAIACPTVHEDHGRRSIRRAVNLVGDGDTIAAFDHSPIVAGRRVLATGVVVYVGRRVRGSNSYRRRHFRAVHQCRSRTAGGWAGNLPVVRATGWHNGTAPDDPSGYGIRLTPRDRDTYFDPSWGSVIVEMDGTDATTVAIAPSFWRSCPELRSADIGRWFLDAQTAPWAKGSPPGIAVEFVAENRFAVRVLKRRTLGQR